MKENDEEQDTREESLQQTVIRLPHLNEEIPALRASDGKLYIPVIALCHMLGIEPDRHIRRWRQMLLWEGSLKLPYRSPQGYQRTVWCLPLPMVPFACSYCNWNLVSPERREQLHRLADEANGVLYRRHMQMVDTYHITRQFLFRFLTTTVGAANNLRQKAPFLAQQLDEESRTHSTAFIEQGCALITTATEQAKAILHWQSDTPIIDVFSQREDGTIEDEYSMPLLPVLPEGEYQALFATIDGIIAWHSSFSEFLTLHGF
ncbi:MAG: hypothetical protein H0V70_03150 [Ktedonobacteraceae bacterium]|nr:hypothetical protein [Ktedonobacteraceae bacterium]